MSTATVQSLNQRQVRQWETDGWLLLRGIIPDESVQAMRAMFGRVVDGYIGQLKAEGLVTDERRDLPFERRFAVVAGPHATRFGRSLRRDFAQRELFDLHHSQPLVSIIAELTGTDVIGHPVFNARPKLPGQQFTVVPWHQDSAYFGRESERSLIITCWIPLVPVDASNGCLQVIPGTHRMGWIEHKTEEREGKFLEVDGSRLPEAGAVTCPMQPGDALLFPNLTFHRSLPSTAETIRWSVDLRFVRDGDYPGQPRSYWPDPSFQWVIRSHTQPVTAFEEWQRQTRQLSW
jgi:phytanoyl-CoA hydroxylase